MRLLLGFIVWKPAFVMTRLFDFREGARRLSFFRGSVWLRYTKVADITMHALTFPL